MFKDSNFKGFARIFWYWRPPLTLAPPERAKD
jgi:hypothetical protein